MLDAVELPTLPKLSPLRHFNPARPGS